MQYKKILLSLILIPELVFAATSPNDYYNVSEVATTTRLEVFHNELEGQGNVVFSSYETFAYQERYNSSNQTAEFNNGNGATNNWEYAHEIISGYWFDVVNSSSNFWTNTNVALNTYDATSSDSWVVDSSFIQMSNLFLLTGTDTFTESGIADVEEMVNKPIIFTSDADLSFNAGIIAETSTYEATAASMNTTAPVSVDKVDVDSYAAIGLKQGSITLAATDIIGNYQFTGTGFNDYCKNTISGACLEQVQESWVDMFAVNFDGNGNCTIAYFVGKDFALQRYPNNIASPLIYADSYNDTANLSACSYSVSDLDKLELTWIYTEGSVSQVETLQFTVSATHRYLTGLDQFSATPLSSGDFDRGMFFGMKKTSGLAEYDFNGTYLGSYQGTVYDNTNDTATDVTSIKYSHRNFVLTFDGLGGCTYKENKALSTFHNYPATSTNEIISENISNDFICDSYTIVTQASGNEYVKIVVVKDKLIFNAYLSDNGETLSFIKGIAKNSNGGLTLLANDGSNGISSADFANTASILKTFKGLAIKYAGDEQSKTQTIDAWLKTKTDRLQESAKQEEFVERFYQNILGRASDAGGMEHWKKILQTSSASQVAMGFLNSPEFINRGLNNSEYVNTLYQTMFNRPADTGGFDLWKSKLDGGELHKIVNYGFFRSQEFKNLSDSFGVTAFSVEDESTYQVSDFVKRFYTLVLNRQPDVGGFDDWSGQLTGGSRTGGDIATGFFQSQEFTNRQTDDSTFLDICYQAFFDRAADDGGKSNWASALQAGSSRVDVVNGFINSLEFTNLAGRYGIAPR